MKNDHSEHASGEHARDAHAPGVAPPLSAAGRARRDAMRDALSAQTVRTARVRRTRRRAAGATLLVLIAAGAAYLILPRTGPAPHVPPIATDDRAPIDSAPRAEPSMRIQIVSAGMDPERLAAITVATTPDLARYAIDDDALLGLLDEAGRPTGIARTPDGRVWLTSNVTDPLGVNAGG